MHALESGRWRRREKLFGIGLSRTGTTSLNTAFGLLGLRSAHFPCDQRTRQEIHRFLNRPGTRLALRALRSHDALTDTPVCVGFEALDATYPHSLFVLTVRDKEGWLKSCEAYWRGIHGFLRDQTDDPIAAYMVAIAESLYGSSTFRAEAFSRAYDAYHDRVARHFRGRGRDLLVLDLFSGQGWPELCRFLGLPVVQGAFPVENRAAES